MNGSSFGNTAGIVGASAYITIIIIWYLLSIVGYWKVFTKADKPGWHSLIPFLNIYDLFEIGDINGYYSLFIFIPIIGGIIYLIYLIQALIGISHNFGKSSAFAALLFFLGPIGLMILGFSDAGYNGKDVHDTRSDR